MTKDEITEIIKETAYVTKNSLFDENSNLVDMLVHKMEGHIEKSVDKATEKYTNGKLKLLDAKNDQHAQEIKDKQESIKISLEEFKEEIRPQIQLIKDTQGFGKVSLYFLAFVTAVGVVIKLAYELFKIR